MTHSTSSSSRTRESPVEKLSTPSWDDQSRVFYWLEVLCVVDSAIERNFSSRTCDYVSGAKSSLWMRTLEVVKDLFICIAPSSNSSEWTWWHSSTKTSLFILLLRDLNDEFSSFVVFVTREWITQRRRKRRRKKEKRISVEPRLYHVHHEIIIGRKLD